MTAIPPPRAPWGAGPTLLLVVALLALEYLAVVQYVFAPTVKGP